jgi:hypothetical protein
VTIPPDQLRQFFRDVDTFGELCDIVVPESDLQTWERFLLFVRSRGRYTFSIEDKEQEIPADPRTALGCWTSPQGPDTWLLPSLEFEVAGLQVRTFFHTTPEWFNLDFARDAVTPEMDEEIVDFIQQLGDALERDILLTPEGRWMGATFAYDHAARTFRRPLRARGTNGVIKRKVMDALRAALAPFRSLTPPPPSRQKPTGPRTSLIPDDMLRTALAAIEKTSSEYTELMLQDNFTSQEREEIHHVWGLAQSILPEPDETTKQHHERNSRERELIRLAKEMG